MIAFAEIYDAQQAVGTDIVRAVDSGYLPNGEIATDTLLEILNIVHERNGRETATELLDRLLEEAHIQLEHATRQQFENGRSLFRRYDGLSFGDAMNVPDMQGEGLDIIYSFDDAFDAVAGITRLATAANPVG